MTRIHCDVRRLEQALEKLQSNDEYDRLEVLDTDCVLRGITREEMEERNIRSYPQICRIEDNTTNSFKFKFHQNAMGDFDEVCITPPEPDAIDPQYCTTPEQLEGAIELVADELNDIYSDIIWDLGSINAASFASGGHLTDFEFEYEMIVRP